jgi:hypothetical protein
MKRPDVPAAGDPLSASWAKTLIDWIDTFRITPSADIKPEITTRGTSLSFRAKGKQNDNQALRTRGWEFTQTDYAKGTLSQGPVYIGGDLPGIADWPDGSELEVTDEGTTKYWLKYDITHATLRFVAGDAGDDYPDCEPQIEIWPILELTAEDQVVGKDDAGADIKRMTITEIHDPCSLHVAPGA